MKLFLVRHQRTEMYVVCAGYHDVVDHWRTATAVNDAVDMKTIPDPESVHLVAEDHELFVAPADEKRECLNCGWCCEDGACARPDKTKPCATAGRPDWKPRDAE